MDRVIERYGQLLWPAGKRFRYTNLGYGVLGRIVELQSGKPFGNFLSEVLAPLNMGHTTLGIDTQAEVGASGSLCEGWQQASRLRGESGGSGGCVVERHDSGRFGQLHCPAAEHHLASLPKRAIDEMQRVVSRCAPEQWPGWVMDRGLPGRYAKYSMTEQARDLAPS